MATKGKKSSPKKKSSQPSPKPVPPKRTGKAGIGPLEHPGDLVQQDETRTAKENATVTSEPVKEEGSSLPESEKKTPRQRRLPGLEDAKIEELESAAEEYADIRDRRMALTTDEVACKEELLALMKKHGKVSYIHNGYDIKVVVESEKLKVKIKKED
jgi:hypothetical protein